MFDGNFRTGVDRVTKPIGKALVRVGVTADLLTIFGVVIAIGCAYEIATGHFFIGFILLVLSGLPDLLDGPVAKAAGTQSVRGAFFDSVSDRVSDTLVLGGMAWYFAGSDHPLRVMLPMALLGSSQILSYMRAKAEIHGFDAKGGIMERAERVIALCIGLAVSSILVPVLGITLALTLVTCLQRFVKIWRQATAENPVLLARSQTRPWGRNLLASWTESDERRRRVWRERMEAQRLNRRRSRNQ